MNKTNRKMPIPTPYYLIDENRMLPALEKIRYVQDKSGAKSVLALKCFSSWCVFDFMKGYLAGTTSSSVYEAMLGAETFGGENHGYAVAYTEEEIRQIEPLCDKVIFNSVNQLKRFAPLCSNASIGLRINPEIGYSEYILSNPVWTYSRLGVTACQLDDTIFSLLDGITFHMNCENANFASLKKQVDAIADRFGHALGTLHWVSLGGGISFTNDDYPLADFITLLANFARAFNVQVYLEPGEAAVTESTSLVVSVLDIVDNGLPTLVVDAGVETHLLDVLTYRYTPALENATAVNDKDVEALLRQGKKVMRVSGRSCLQGDHFGHYIFDDPIAIGSQLTFTDTGGYSMVKKNFFNGLNMPSICHRKLNGDTRVVREFSYEDFKHALS